MSLIQIKGLIKEYGTKNDPIRALGPIDLEIKEGSFTVIIGRSGSGKSTLLNLISGLDKATSGSLKVDDKELTKKRSKGLAKYRAGNGIIFQSYNLLPNLNTVENVQMGGWAAGANTTKEEAQKLLTDIGLSHRLDSNVKTLSGGERQRVAICRALVGDPKLIFCDEPTGALDTKNEKLVESILVKLNKEQGKTIVLVTHNPEFVNIATQVVDMQDGVIKEIKDK